MAIQRMVFNVILNGEYIFFSHFTDRIFDWLKEKEYISDETFFGAIHNFQYSDDKELRIMDDLKNTIIIQREIYND